MAKQFEMEYDVKTLDPSQVQSAIDFYVKYGNDKNFNQRRIKSRLDYVMIVYAAYNLFPNLVLITLLLIAGIFNKPMIFPATSEGGLNYAMAFENFKMTLILLVLSLVVIGVYFFIYYIKDVYQTIIIVRDTGQEEATKIKTTFKTLSAQQDEDIKRYNDQAGKGLKPINFEEVSEIKPADALLVNEPAIVGDNIFNNDKIEVDKEDVGKRQL